ncbi:MAG TPA: agmatine deiminase family protein [Bacteroidota bacterium]
MDNQQVHRLRMPAEWERHDATWISWPANLTDWPGKITPVSWAFGEMARKLSQGEMLHIIVNSTSHEAKARRILERVGVDFGKVRFFRFPSDRGWTRDSGPMFVQRSAENEVAIIRFRFTAWSRYPNWKRDDATPVRAAKSMKFPIVPARFRDRDVVLEGGSIDVNGSGTLLTTEECLLDEKVQVRNQGFTREDYNDVFKMYHGATNVLWLGHGIVGDDTHGHVDDLCRFVNRSTVVLAQEEHPGDQNYRPLKENFERLQGMKLEDGSKIEVVTLPMPAPLYYGSMRLPASYANFYISNDFVIVPTFNDPNDRVALGILSELITDRTVVGIHAVDLVLGFGTLHCLTQQQPAALR